MSKDSKDSVKDATTQETVFKAQVPYGHFLNSPTFTLTAGDSKKAFYVHKELLGGISPELRKHTHNEMKEGSQNAMKISDVSEDTIKRFLEWAYTNDYPEEIYATNEVEEVKQGSKVVELTDLVLPTVKNDKVTGSTSATAKEVIQKTSPSACLLCHAQLYVFADRFNIALLKNLSFTKLTSILASLDEINDPRDICDVIDLLTYAFDNLPLKKSGEKLLDYLLHYSAWTLDSLRKYSPFWTLVDSNPDFAKALLGKAEQMPSPPWGPVAQGKKNQTGIQKRKQLLERYCNSCAFQGVFHIVCPSCQRYDWEINQGTDLDGDLLRRLENTSVSQWRCPHCGWGVGKPTLWCAKCRTNRGY